MKDWLSRTQIRQRPMLAVYGLLLTLIAVVVAVTALNWLNSSSSDRLAVIGNLLSLGTLLLALVAGIVALAAYSAATGLPNLKLRIMQPMGLGNRMRFVPGADGSAQENTAVTVLVRNTSSYAARSPAISVFFEGGMIEADQMARSREWVQIGHPSSGAIIAFQWDGGPNYSIHGNSLRYLPELNLQGLHPLAPGAEVTITISVFADGYSRPAIILPVEFTDRPAMRDPMEHPPGWR
jgi:hypothetical protein